MLADLGFNTYRFSLEWARIEPEEGYFSLAELEHYRRMLAACHEHHLTPLLTYSHFSVSHAGLRSRVDGKIRRPPISMRVSARRRPGTWAI